jgi:hypothetical protein
MQLYVSTPYKLVETVMKTHSRMLQRDVREATACHSRSCLSALNGAQTTRPILIEFPTQLNPEFL